MGKYLNSEGLARVWAKIRPATADNMRRILRDFFKQDTQHITPGEDWDVTDESSYASALSSMKENLYADIARIAQGEATGKLRAGVCDTAAGTIAKTVQTNAYEGGETYVPVSGDVVLVYFTNKNTARGASSGPTLSVDGSTAYEILVNDLSGTPSFIGDSVTEPGVLSGYCLFVFNNNKWYLVSPTPWVDSKGNHYTPATDSSASKTASASGGTAAWDMDVVKGVTLQTDGKGHVTGLSVTSGKVPANPTSWTDGTSALSWNTEVTLGTVDGHAIKAKLPANPNTDTKVTSAANHYTPAADSSAQITATVEGTPGSYAKDTEYTVLTGVKAQRDAKGHVTGLTYTAQKVKDTNTTYSAMSASEAQTGTATTGRIITAKVMGDEIDRRIAAAQAGAALFQGTLSAQSTLTNADYKKGWYWVVDTAGTYAGQVCEVGDFVFAVKDKATAYAAADFSVVQNNIDTITDAEIDSICV